MKMTGKLGLLAGLLMICAGIKAQPQTLVESVAGIVGNEVIYLSEVETGVMEVRRSEPRIPVDELRCRVFQ